MFSECEQWRKDFEVDEIARSFKFEENALVTVYYPRYYHKTDKVYFPPQGLVLMIGWTTRVH
jgi:hypothetical protein